MKKLISLSLLVCLCALAITAHAASPYVSIAELREEVRSGWHQTYQAHGREITIALDEILIPEVDAVPVLTVRGVDPVPQDRYGGLECSYNEMGAANFATGSYFGEGDGFFKGKTMGTLTDRVYTADDVDLTYHADGNAASVGDMIEIVRSSVAQWYGPFIADAMTLASVTIGTKALHYNAKTNTYGDIVDHPDNRGVYTVEMYQALYGIPVLYANGGYFSTLKGEKYGLSSRVFGYMHRTDKYAINTTLVQETDVKHADVPLLPFAEIQPVFEKLIADGRLRTIEHLQLGYVLYIDPKDSGINWAVPTWVARAEFYDDASGEAYEESWGPGGEIIRTPNKTLMFVQAQTGAFLDPLSKSAGRRDVAKILTWSGMEQ